MILFSLGMVVVGTGIWAGYTHFYEGRLGQPVYEIIARHNDVEFRRYEPFVIATTQLEARGNNSLRNGFRTLAGYIFGGNQPGESIPMTAPVLQQNGQGESLPMTAPVIQSADGMRMAFVMPAGRSPDDLPVPNNQAITVSNVDWGEVAALRFSGRGEQARFQAAEVELRSTLEAQGRTPSGPALYAQYNSPSAFPPLRRNEVMIPLSPQ